MWVHGIERKLPSFYSRKGPADSWGVHCQLIWAKCNRYIAAIANQFLNLSAIVTYEKFIRQCSPLFGLDIFISHNLALPWLLQKPSELNSCEVDGQIANGREDSFPIGVQHAVSAAFTIAAHEDKLLQAVRIQEVLVAQRQKRRYEPASRWVEDAQYENGEHLKENSTYKLYPFIVVNNNGLLNVAVTHRVRQV